MRETELDVARRRLNLPVMELWVDYFALGGHLDAHGLGACLRGDLAVDEAEHNVIAHALNERFSGSGENHPVPYRSIRGALADE